MPLNKNENLLVLVDIETTGLKSDEDLPLEVGCLLVDIDFNEIASFSTLVPWDGKIDWDKITPYVQDMHTKNGLRADLDAAVASGKWRSAFEADQALQQFLLDHGAEHLPMMGSNVANFDRPFLKEYFPGFEGLFHYRNIDVSTIKETCRRWNPEVYSKLPPKNEVHRVIEDCWETIGEFKFYRDNFLFTTR